MSYYLLVGATVDCGNEGAQYEIRDRQGENVALRGAHVTFDVQAIAREVHENLEVTMGPQHREVWNALLQTTTNDNEQTPRPVLTSTV